MDSQNKSDDFDIVKWQEENPDVWGDQDEKPCIDDATNLSYA